MACGESDGWNTLAAFRDAAQCRAISQYCNMHAKACDAENACEYWLCAIKETGY
jgi:hypothetical protein